MPLPPECAELERLTRETVELFHEGTDAAQSWERRIARALRECLGDEKTEVDYTVERHGHEFLAVVHTTEGQFYAALAESRQIAIARAVKSVLDSLVPTHSGRVV